MSSYLELFCILQSFSRISKAEVYVKAHLTSKPMVLVWQVVTSGRPEKLYPYDYLNIVRKCILPKIH